MFRLGGSNVLGLRRGKIRPRWSCVGTKLAYVGPGLDLCWLMLAHVGCKVGLCWRKSGFRSLQVGSQWARTPNPLSVLDSPPLPPCAPSGPLGRNIHIYVCGVGGKKEVKKEVIKEKMIRLRKEGSLLDGARVPRFPSYIYIYIYKCF